MKTTDPVARSGCSEEPGRNARPSFVIRKLNRLDVVALRDHLQRLDAETLTMRFCGAVSDSFLGDYARKSFEPRKILHGAFVDGVLRGVGELIVVGSWPKRTGEAAFSVESASRRSGMGSALFARTLSSARNRGIYRLTISCLAWNEPMQALARHFHSQFEWKQGEVVGTVLTRAASPLSLIDEMAMDTLGAWSAFYQKRMVAA